ncbi:MAG: Cj0069 family protein [Anaerolineae bacterium]|nr:Cj0069 family protein [Anaerolineae bacterium]
MMDDINGRVAILYPENRTAAQSAKVETPLFLSLFRALTDKGLQVEPTAYHDDFCEDVRRKLLKVDAVLVWVNPIEGGHDRSLLDAMLREIVATGVFVSTHPDIILKMGTKEVLYRTRDVGWGCDTHLYLSMAQMRQELALRLASGQARVLKQYRGNGGMGVWKVQLPIDRLGNDNQSNDSPLPNAETLIRVRHAMRGSVEEEMTLAAFLNRCQEYFAGDGRMIDQEYQERLAEGMIRCYLVHDKVAGFGHQAVNALFPAPPGAPPSEAPPPGPRLYHPPTMPEFQALKHKLEREWVPAMQELLQIDTRSLPILWDCDFLLGPKEQTGADTYVLCEINVSSVSPFPESAIPYIAQATAAQVHKHTYTSGGLDDAGTRDVR